MKSIGLSDEVYTKLLNTKHQMETKEDRAVSFDKAIDKLIEGYNAR